MTKDRPLNMRALTGDNGLCQQQSGALKSALGHTVVNPCASGHRGFLSPPAPSERFLISLRVLVHFDASLTPLATWRAGRGGGVL
jgi:hypothetical protein